MEIVLASASPRRREILGLLPLPFTVAVPAVGEDMFGQMPAPALAEALAAAKARAVAAVRPRQWVIAADTIVVLAGAVLGKPAGAEEARAMLRALRGREHRVITGLALAPAGGAKPLTISVATAVRMRAYSEPELDAYLASGDPFDKAGAYAIQHPVFAPVAGWRGCYLNVVGLPLCHLLHLANEAGLALPAPAAAAVPAQCGACVLGRG